MCDMIYGQRSDAVDGWMNWMGIYIYIWFGTTPTEPKKNKENNKKTRIVIKIYKGFKLLGRGEPKKRYCDGMSLEGGFGGIKTKLQKKTTARERGREVQGPYICI